jgi:hypothetical protein
MNATQGLVKSYVTENASTTQYAAVVQGSTADGNCKLPAGANAQGFLGITLEPQSAAGRAVAVQKNGIARAMANGTIARGDAVAIASAAGDLASVQTIVAAAPGAASCEYVVGFAEESAVNGQIFAVWINPQIVKTAVS